MLVPLTVLAAVAPTAQARDCKLDGVDINPDNGASYAGKSGRIKCYDDDGTLLSEEEVRNGEMIGYERRRDLWGNISERTTNANGNTEGVAREFYPDGTLKSEATYEDGDIVGTARSFHKNGKLARLAHESGDDSAVLEYDADGKLTSLRCASRSLLPEDRKPCGFGGESETTLFRNGRASERVAYRDGKLQRHESLAADGAVTASSMLEAGAEVRRTFHADGKPASELRVVDGYHVAEREWYMNGQLKLEITREPKDRDARSETVSYRDDGTLASREIRAGRDRVSCTLYDEAGKVKQIDDYSPQGNLDRRRKFAADGSVISDEYFHPDGSRK